MRVAQPGPAVRSPRSARRAVVLAVPALIGVLGLAACSGSHSSPSAQGASAADTGTTSSRPQAVVQAQAAVITTAPATGAKQVDPSQPVTVRIAHGTLSSVRMTNPAGKTVTGTMAAGDASWHSTEDLGYGRTYTVTATGASAQGATITERSRFTTVDPSSQVNATIDRTGGYALTDGATYGVGIVPIVHFDEAITGKAAKAAVLKTLSVGTSPQVAGAWAWYGTHDVHYRPQAYWPSGTKVTVAAKIYGKNLGHGLYGASDVSASFTIGRKEITIAQDNAPKVDKVRVYRNGVLVRTMNTSMGKHSGTYSGGNYIDFHTMKGTYTVLEHDDPAIMSSASYGLAATDPGGYAPEKIYYATKISTDGIYLHYLDTIYAQDNGVDVSHGCLNLNHANAVWFYKNSLIGDPVQISGTKGPKNDVAQGGDWSVPWSTWSTGSITSS